jgi:hypothetical protein
VKIKIKFQNKSNSQIGAGIYDVTGQVAESKFFYF